MNLKLDGQPYDEREYTMAKMAIDRINYLKQQNQALEKENHALRETFKALGLKIKL